MPNNERATKPLTGFAKCLAEWRRIHKDCPLFTGNPNVGQIQLMRHGYEAGRNDGRSHK